MSFIVDDKMNGIDLLLKHWDDCDPSTDGNILPYRHSNFETSIETGVRQLVFLFVKKYQWITYSSCEGHYEESSLRDIGILCRNRSERVKIVEILSIAAQKVGLNFNEIKVKIIEHEMIEKEKYYPVVSVIFDKSKFLTFEKYFKEIDQVTEAFLQALY